MLRAHSCFTHFARYAIDMRENTPTPSLFSGHLRLRHRADRERQRQRIPRHMRADAMLYAYCCHYIAALLIDSYMLISALFLPLPRHAFATRLDMLSLSLYYAFAARCYAAITPPTLLILFYAPCRYAAD